MCPTTVLKADPSLGMFDRSRTRHWLRAMDEANLTTPS